MTQTKLQPISARRGEPAVSIGQQFCYALDPVWEEAIQALLVHWSIEFWSPVNKHLGQVRVWSKMV